MPLALILILLAGPATAHPGHLVDAAGHNHWVAGAAIGAAVIIGVWGALKGRKKPAPAPQEDTSTEEAA